MRTKLEWVPDALTSKRPLLLTAAKDKPVLISALADRSKVLLTLDLGDFGPLLGTEVYGTLLTTPRDFLQREGLGGEQTLSRGKKDVSRLSSQFTWRAKTT